ncbi:anti-repressor SinI family protein [Bacillus sp. 31A1R]|uniref:Anti-repressor SinI family protein n=1 Tax=Robertmurraya mangrovi TaxID=3098077 RepID=A0ABU5J294_9BACI|nr:anti-repressor SinI family protein [Bacillus sp. 31A1R]MDZ5473526.1 anti-repressor SinI family protein [Bacillus sp. 31A1R]
MIESRVVIEELDFEWMQLILEARRLGLQKEDIKEFLSQNGMKEMTIENR